MDFCYALQSLKEGLKVSREGWNGKGMWIAISKPLKCDPIVPFPTMTVPFIFMKTVQGDFVPWLASQTDLLAEDYEIVK